MTAPGETSGVKVPPPLYCVVGFLIGVVVELFVPVGRPPLWVTLVGAVIGFAGSLVLDGGATLRFARARTSPIPMKPSTALVTDGPYRFTRNPMYLGMALLYIGFAFAFGFVWPFVVLPFVLIAVDRLVIAKEEPYLRRRFGAAYVEYSDNVRRWV